MSLQEIINVNITKQTASISRAGFGVACLVGYHTAFANRVRQYSDLAGLVSDGFTTDHPIYLAATKLLSQDNKPPVFKVGRRALPPTRRVVITCAEKNTTQYTVTINGTAFSFTSDANATNLEVAAGLVGVINGGSVPVTAADVLDGTFTVQADNVGEHFTLELADNANEGLLTQEDTTVDPGLATDLAAIEAEDDAWYALQIVDAHSKPQITAAAAWTEARRLLYACVSADDPIKDPGASDDVFSLLNGSNYARTLPLAHPQVDQYGDAAWLGRVLPQDPGSITWAHKQLAGVPVAKFSSTDRAQIQLKGGNDYTGIAGRGVTRYGQTPSGEFADITRGIDWLTAQFEEELFLLLQNNEKIPFTNGGIDLIRGNLLAVCQRGIAVGLVAADPTPTVEFPDVSAISQGDKAARTLTGGQIALTLAGAIHRVTFNVDVAI